MHGCSLILLAIWMLIAVEVLATEPLLPDASACSEQPDHAGQRECLEQRASAREGQIAVAEQRVREAIMHWDQEAEYRDRSMELLDRSRQAYLTQRSAACEAEASTAEGGNSAGDLRLECQERWDRKWIEQLSILEQMYGRDL